MDVAFPELYNSAMIKAMKVSPTIKGITLGPKALSATTLGIAQSGESSQTKLTTSATHVRPYRKLQSLRRPNKSIPSSLPHKSISAELIKANQNEINEINSNLELAAKERDEEILKRLAHAHMTYTAQRNVEIWKLEKSYLSKTPLPKFEESNVSETEEDIQAATRAQQRTVKVMQDIEESKKKQERKQILDQIFSVQTSFSAEYQKLLETIKTCLNRTALKPIIDSFNLQQSSAVFEKIIRKSPDQITLEDLTSLFDLLRNLQNGHELVKAEVEKINEAIAEEERILQKEKEAAENQQAAEAQKPKDISTLSDCFDKQSLATYSSLRQHLVQVKQSLEPLLKDDSLKKFRFDLRKAVTTPVNAISPVSAEHMMDKYRKLHNILSGSRVDAAGGAVQANRHPLGVTLCEDILSKLMVRQGDVTVSSKPDAAFAIASILVNLWVDFPSFGLLVHARFQSRCPYLAPVFLPQMEGQTNLDYYSALGYECEGGEVEKQDKFLKRMKGLMRLYAAVLITKPRNGKPNPLGLQEAWRWLAAIMNIQPRPDICAVLILELLEVAGSELLLAYRGQFKKMLAYICQEYFPRLEMVRIFYLFI